MNDSQLDDLLRSATRQILVSPSFRQSVWRRIEVAASDRPADRSWLDSMLLSIAQPFGAVATVAALGLLGLWLGSASLSSSGQSKLSYIESVSPFAAAHIR